MNFYPNLLNGISVVIVLLLLPACTSRIIAKQPVAFWNKPLKINFVDLFKGVGKLAVDASFQNWNNVGLDVVESSAALGLNGTIEESAWLLIYRGTAKALLDLASENLNLMTVQAPSEYDLGELTELIDRSLESLELEISTDFFKLPKEISLVRVIVEVFEGISKNRYRHGKGLEELE